jgi:hypothetical protein
MKTILNLVDDVCVASINIGIDVSVKDVAFILGTFLEGLAAHPASPEADAGLLSLAEEIAKAKDE